MGTGWPSLDLHACDRSLFRERSPPRLRPVCHERFRPASIAALQAALPGPARYPGRCPGLKDHDPLGRPDARFTRLNHNTLRTRATRLAAEGGVSCRRLPPEGGLPSPAGALQEDSNEHYAGRFVRRNCFGETLNLFGASLRRLMNHSHSGRSQAGTGLRRSSRLSSDASR